ncbi:hypothetical protein [Chamaesiphon minutus]|uniref:Uncharacterized protein n=1 Tax=Chamaesiphon minutus (strain ATCC 27169 / PCC 6605) TaxID=1173020 RepID=K9UDI2_CHAP6|nr:hypothetical protein [Chamaesiphon minutus]AFY92708.1 hypothetical protein Cha6605_1549 [Chamaesiphon minutus PCC 6605]
MESGEPLATHLIESHLTRDRNLRRPPGKLTSIQLQQTTDYIHEDLGEELSLTQYLSVKES